MTEVDKLRIAIVSDLHCHHSAPGYTDTLLLSDADRTPSNQHPVQAALELIDERALRADVLLTPGDITNRVDRQGMLSGWGFLQELASALRAPLMVPSLGNHDVNSMTPSDDPFELARKLVPKFPILDTAARNDFWAHGFCLIEASNFQILLLNSVASHGNKESAKRGSVSALQLDQISTRLRSSDPTKARIALFHHHPMLHEDAGTGTEDVMTNGSQLTELLSEHCFHLIIHGHKHYPKLSYAPGVGKLPVLASGSFSAGMKNGLASRTRNVFHIVELELSVNKGQRSRGRILTWQFRNWKGWQPSTWDAADFPHKTGFGGIVDLASIVNCIDDEYSTASRPILDWKQILHRVPDVQYLIPSEFASVGRMLIGRGYKLSPSPPDVPDYLGKVTA